MRPGAHGPPIFRPPASRGPTGYGICGRPASAASTRSGSRSPKLDIFASPPKTTRPRKPRIHRGLRFDQKERGLAPEEPFWGRVSRSSAARPASAGSHRPGNPSAGTSCVDANQLGILPPEVRRKVLSTAERGGLVIEMLWSNSCYLPAHDDGRKYLEMAAELALLMENRLSKGKPFDVLVIKEPLKAQKCMYDKFSEHERSSATSVASNASHKNGPASRIGAFEVHLVQDVWQPKLCAASQAGTSLQVEHRGPPVITSDGILCSACAGSSGGATKMQHVLLHSKLWSRRWPCLLNVLSLTGALVIEEPPEAPMPVVIREVNFQRRKCPELRRSSNVLFQPKDVSVPEDPKRRLKQQIQKRLDALESECQQEWFVDSGNHRKVLCSCGSNCHKLDITDVLPLLVDTARLREDEFRSFVHSKKAEWTAQPLSDFIFHFVDEHMDLVKHRNRHEYARFESQQQLRQKEKELRQEVSSSIRRTRRKSTTIFLEYYVRFEEGQDKAEQIFVSLCIHLIGKVPGHNLNLQPLHEGQASAQEAQELLRKALKLNEQRSETWNQWFRTIDSWKKDDSEKGKELFQKILGYRKDIRDACIAREENGDLVTRQSLLEKEIETFYTRIRQSFVRPDEHQKNVDELERELERTRSQYLEVVEA